MFALSFALLFLLKDYGADRFLNNDDIIYYIQKFKIIHDLSWSEIFYRFKQVCVTGLIENFKGKPEIIASDKSQLSITN